MAQESQAAQSDSQEAAPTTDGAHRRPDQKVRDGVARPPRVSNDEGSGIGGSGSNQCGQLRWKRGYDGRQRRPDGRQRRSDGRQRRSDGRQGGYDGRQRRTTAGVAAESGVTCAPAVEADAFGDDDDGSTDGAMEAPEEVAQRRPAQQRQPEFVEAADTDGVANDRDGTGACQIQWACEGVQVVDVQMLQLGSPPEPRRLQALQPEQGGSNKVGSAATPHTASVAEVGAEENSAVRNGHRGRNGGPTDGTEGSTDEGSDGATDDRTDTGGCEGK